MFAQTSEPFFREDNRAVDGTPLWAANNCLFVRKEQNPPKENLRRANVSTIGKQLLATLCGDAGNPIDCNFVKQIVP